MNDAGQKACAFGGLVVATYAIYTISNPGADGYIFGTVVAAVCAIGGYVVGGLKGAQKAQKQP